MFLNDKKCSNCKHYDPILKGNPRGGLKETPRGWCAKFSLYPYKEGPGQKFPEGVTRVTSPTDRASPKIVHKDEIVPNCSAFIAQSTPNTKAGLIDKLKQEGGGAIT